MARQNIFVGIEYGGSTSPSPAYERVAVKSLDGSELASWGTADVVSDWNACVGWLSGREERAMLTSSLNDFVFDVPGYRWTEDERGTERLVADEAAAPVSPVKA